MADNPGKKSSIHRMDLIFDDIGRDLTPRPRKGSASGSALPQRTFSKEDEQSSEDGIPTDEPAQRSHKRSRSSKEILEKVPLIRRTLQRELSSTSSSKEASESSKSQISFTQENEDSYTMIKNAIFTANLLFRLKNILYEVKGILG